MIQLFKFKSSLQELLWNISHSFKAMIPFSELESTFLVLYVLYSSSKVFIMFWNFKIFWHRASLKSRELSICRYKVNIRNIKFYLHSIHILKCSDHTVKQRYWLPWRFKTNLKLTINDTIGWFSYRIHLLTPKKHSVRI